MNMISGGYVRRPAAQAAQVLVVQGGSVYTEPEPEDRFAVVMEHPFARQRYPDTVQIILDVGSFVIKMDAAAAAVRTLRDSLMSALPAPDQGALDAYQNLYVAGLPAASGEFTGTFGLTEEEINELALPSDQGLDRLAAMMELDLPPVQAPDDVSRAMDQAAKRAMDDARLGLLVHPGNTFQVAASAITIS